MRYDDPQRPVSEQSAVRRPLQTNGSPLPVITLMYPMQGDDDEQTEWVCVGEPHCAGIVRYDGPLPPDAQPCSACESHAPWGWLASIHAHRGTNRFGTHYAWLRDLAAFSADYLADPELALRKYFKYNGPEIEPTAGGTVPLATIDEELF
jgi:hypothetical protein